MCDTFTPGSGRLSGNRSLSLVMQRLPPKWVNWPSSRVRRQLEIERGRVRAFTVQLEYDTEATLDGLGSAEWRQVARFDHAEYGPHDIRREGLHMDVYRNGECVKKVTAFPQVPVDVAPRWCEDFLLERGPQLVERFEKWHSIQRFWARR